MVAYTTPTAEGEPHDGDSPLWRYYGTVLRGTTIYKDGSGWHTLPDYYEEDVLFEPTTLKYYLGGREYDITLAEYIELLLAGLAPYIPGLGTYPSSVTYPGATTFPGV